MGSHARKDRKSAGQPVRRAVRLLQIIERSNETLLGSHDVAGRLRRYAAAHEAPRDDRAAFTKLCHAIFAQGLGFEIVDKHADALDIAFCGFVPQEVATITEARVGKMLHQPIIRNRTKIEACIRNAQRWQALTAGGDSYLGRVARIGAHDDAAAGWPALVATLQEDFCRLGEPTARIVLKRWGFFTAAAHPGVRRAISRLGFVNATANGAVVQVFLGSVAEAASKDPYAVEATVAIFAGLGPCGNVPRCSDCALNEKCPFPSEPTRAAQPTVAAAL